MLSLIEHLLKKIWKSHICGQGIRTIPDLKKEYPLRNEEGSWQLD